MMLPMMLLVVAVDAAGLVRLSKVVELVLLVFPYQHFEMQEMICCDHQGY
jgi:hypothetical protein